MDVLEIASLAPSLALLLRLGRYAFWGLVALFRLAQRPKLFQSQTT